MTPTTLSGVYTALFTPLNNDCPNRLYNTIDYDKAKVMIDVQIAAGVSGLVPVGTTGQSATVTTQQHLDFVKFVVDYVGDRCQVIAGAGSNCTRESVEMINTIQEIKKLPVLCVTGYYNNPTQFGVKKHFETLASETGAEIVLYNVPGRTNSYINADTVIELAENPQFIALKQAVDFKVGGEHRAETVRIIEATKDMPFNVLSGEDDAVAQIIRDGGTGVISATANIPEALDLFVKIIKTGNSQDFAKSEEFQDELDPFVKACFSRKNPIPLGTFFNSPMFQPLCDVRETEDGQLLHDHLMDFMRESAPSLLQYQ